MTGPVERVPLTDQQLAEVHRLLGAPLSASMKDMREARDLLFGELGAARAGERELAAELSVLRSALRAAKGHIDKALRLAFASDDGSEYEHTHPASEGEPECPACWAVDIRAALTGTEDRQPAVSAVSRWSFRSGASV